MVRGAPGHGGIWPRMRHAEAHPTAYWTQQNADGVGRLGLKTPCAVASPSDGDGDAVHMHSAFTRKHNTPRVTRAVLVAHMRMVGWPFLSKHEVYNRPHVGAGFWHSWCRALTTQGVRRWPCKTRTTLPVNTSVTLTEWSPLQSRTTVAPLGTVQRFSSTRSCLTSPSRGLGPVGHVRRAAVVCTPAT